MNAYMKRKHKKELRAPVHNMWTLEKPICGCVFFFFFLVCFSSGVFLPSQCFHLWEAFFFYSACVCVCMCFVCSKEHALQRVKEQVL